MLLGIIILGVFGALSIVNRFVYGEDWPLSFKGRVSISVMLAFASFVSLLKTEELTKALPLDWDFAAIIIYVFAGLNLVFGVGILYPKIIKWKSILLMIYLAMWIPCYVIGTNQGAEVGGLQNGITNLYYKIPIQLGMMFWVYYFGIRDLDVKVKKASKTAKKTKEKTRKSNVKTSKSGSSANAGGAQTKKKTAKK